MPLKAGDFLGGSAGNGNNSSDGASRGMSRRSRDSTETGLDLSIFFAAAFGDVFLPR